MRRIIKSCLLISVLVLVFPLVVSASETDLQINVDTITMREYNGATLTDKYDAELLTESGYRNAETITEKKRVEAEQLRGTVYAGPIREKNPPDDVVLLTAEKAALFGEDYEPSDIKKTEEKGKNNTMITVLIISMSAMTGLVAGMLTRRKSGKVEE